MHGSGIERILRTKCAEQIQLISGHESKKSLEIYQHLSLGAVEQAYQEAVQGVSI